MNVYTNSWESILLKFIFLYKYISINRNECKRSKKRHGILHNASTELWTKLIPSLPHKEWVVEKK